MVGQLQERFPRLAIAEIFRAAGHHSRSQLYQWCGGVSERKPRPPKALAEEVIAAATAVIVMFPHFGGGKGQAYLLYHQLGLIGQRAFDGLKKMVKRILCQEASSRRDRPGGRETYEHIRPRGVGQIWAEDFTEVVVDGETFKVALLIDVYSHYILGWALARRATESLVARPVHQALEVSGDKPPELFLLEDNGRQYSSENHQRLLTSREIVSRHVPPYTPQYNGAVECGGKEFKNVFYTQWEARTTTAADKEKTLLEEAEQVAAATVQLLNEVIPRPALGGVTPADVQQGEKERRRQEIELYRQQELAKPEPPPLSRSIWEVVKQGVKAEAMSTKELLTKLAFFGMRPLRRVAQLNREVWGN
jgi:transposase InsO family protein